MAGYIEAPVVTDPDQLTARALDFLTANVPGFVPRDGHLEVWLIMALARMVAENRDVASRVPRSIFRYFGKTLLGLPAEDAVAATTPSTWTAIDNAGYTVLAGTVVAFQTTGDTLVPFAVVDDVVIPPGATTTAAGAVTLAATVPGTGGNGIPAGPLLMVDALAWVVAVVSTATTAGGVDAETDDQYLDRLAEELQLMSPEPILPNDFAVLAKRVAGVYRATAIDGYDPVTATFGNERLVAVAPVGADGLPVSGGIKADVQTYLDALREVNFVVNVIDPTYTPVGVIFTGIKRQGADAATVQQAAIDAVTAYLDPANWAGGNESPPVWRTNENVVRFLEVAATLNAVADLDYVTSLSVNGGQADIVLGGVAPLPTPGAIVGVVV